MRASVPSRVSVSANDSDIALAAGEFPEEQPLNRELDGNSVEHNLYSVMVYAENIFNARLLNVNVLVIGRLTL